MVKDLNSQLGEAKLPDEVFRAVFGKWWPDLEQSITATMRNVASENVEPRRETSDVLGELLELARSQQNQLATLREQLESTASRYKYRPIDFPGSFLSERPDPAVAVTQGSVVVGPGYEHGRLGITVLRSLNTVTGTGKFTTRFTERPTIEIELLRVPSSSVVRPEIMVRPGAYDDFNVHLNAGPGGLLDTGEYQIAYRAAQPILG